MYFLSTKEIKLKSYNRQGCKEFNGLRPQGVLSYKERRRKSIMRRVQLKGSFVLRFLPYREERVPREESKLKKTLA